MKNVVFHPRALDELRAFPVEVRKAIGKALADLQKGHSPGMPLSKPMPTVGNGVEELRVHSQTGAFRAFYYKKTMRGILVFHAFQKKSQKTQQRDIILGTKRLREMLNEEI